MPTPAASIASTEVSAVGTRAPFDALRATSWFRGDRPRQAARMPDRWVESIRQYLDAGFD
jgi:hypothetical protein